MSDFARSPRDAEARLDVHPFTNERERRETATTVEREVREHWHVHEELLVEQAHLFMAEHVSQVRAQAEDLATQLDRLPAALARDELTVDEAMSAWAQADNSARLVLNRAYSLPDQMLALKAQLEDVPASLERLLAKYPVNRPHYGI